MRDVQAAAAQRAQQARAAEQRAAAAAAAAAAASAAQQEALRRAERVAEEARWLLEACFVSLRVRPLVKPCPRWRAAGKLTCCVLAH